MSLEFKLPDIGEGIAEGEIARWHVTAGQTVAENDPFVEVMTDKATVEIPAPASGVIEAIRFAQGATVPVGTVIAVIATVDHARKAAPAPARSPAAVASGTAAAAPARAPATEIRGPAPAKVPAEVSTSVSVAPEQIHGVRVLASPAVRRLAREHGIDLRTLKATGPAGRVTREDLISAVQKAAQPAGAREVLGEPALAGTIKVSASRAVEERVPLRGIRKRIAERMARSKHTAAHFTYVDECDVTALVDMRESLKAVAAEQGVKLTYMPFVVQAVTTALSKFPMLNASLDEAAQEIVYKRYYHIGFAADTPQGLVVPVIKDADQRSLLNLGSVINDLAERARAGKLTLEEVTGSTFTITNAGSIGGLLATPVINHPEVAILGVHKIQDRAVVRNGAIVVRKMMNLSISLDHRLVDGADGARFMNEVIRMLEEPRLLMLGSK